MIGLSADCCAYAARPMTSNAGATICGTRACSGLSFVPDICDVRVLLIAALSEFTPSAPSLTGEPTIDDSFILNQMVHNEGRIQERDGGQRWNMIANLIAAGFGIQAPETSSVRCAPSLRHMDSARLCCSLAT